MADARCTNITMHITSKTNPKLKGKESAGGATRAFSNIEHGRATSSKCTQKANKPHKSQHGVVDFITNLLKAAAICGRRAIRVKWAVAFQLRDSAPQEVCGNTDRKYS